MKKENLLTVLEEYISRVPYHPFTIVMNDGSSCEQFVRCHSLQHSVVMSGRTILNHKLINAHS